MTDALLDLPSHLRERLASALESGLLAAPHSAASLRSVLGNPESVKEVVGALLELEHPEMPTEKPIFHLHVVGNSSMSWADIKPNWEFDERNEERGTKVKRALKVV